MVDDRQTWISNSIHRQAGAMFFGVMRRAIYTAAPIPARENAPKRTRMVHFNKDTVLEESAHDIPEEQNFLL